MGELVKALKSKEVIFFLSLTFIFSWFQEILIIKQSSLRNSYLVLSLMWTPGLVALFLKIILKGEGPVIGFKKGKLKYYFWSYIIPALSSLIILLLLALSGIGELSLSEKLIEEKGGALQALTYILFVAPFFSYFIGYLLALGEEIGWRGYLHSSLKNVEPVYAFIFIGLIWTLWHAPLILFSDYATSNFPALSFSLFCVVTVSASIIMGWLREASASVFTAALFHMSHNLWMQAVSPAFIQKGPLYPYFGGESGVFNALTYLVLAIFIYYRFFKKNFRV